MSRFADAPYFMLKDYVNLVVAPPNDDILDSDVVLFWEDVVFTDVVWIGGNTRIVTSSPYTDSTDLYPGYDDAQIFEHEAVQWNAHWDTNPNASYFLEDADSVGVLMRGMEKSIIVTGGQYIDLFAKIDDEENPLYGEYGFAPVRLKPVYEEPREKVYFRFDIVDVTTLNPDPTFTLTYDSDEGSCSAGGWTDRQTCEDNGETWTSTDEPYFDSKYIQYKTFDYSYSEDITNEDALQPSTEIYFRKDGTFHEWLKLHANEFYETQLEVDFIIRNYVNTDKLFLYFGQIFPTAKDAIDDPDRYHIVFNGLKDWVQAALPSNNRTDNLVEWNDTYFDMVHWEGYQLLKDIWSLRDANECDEKFLSYIPTFYGIPLYNRLDDNFTPIYREYSRDLVNLLKRKGTYASMYVIYDLFCNNSPNIFNVYERWHNTSYIGGTVPSGEWEDYIYTGLYGRTEPTDETTDIYGYLVSVTEFEDPPANSKPFYIDQNHELIEAADEKNVIQDNLLISSNIPVVDVVGNVYITRGATTFMLYKVADVAIQPPDTDFDAYGYLYSTLFGYYVDDNGVVITYDGSHPIFSSLLLLDPLGGVVVDGSDDVYIDLYPYVQKVSLQKALTFPHGAGEFWYDKSDTSTYPDGYVSSDDRMLSPYYRADLDLNVKPITNTKILPRNVSENLYMNWEYMRPINRQAEYNYIYAPFTDLTGQSWSLYPHPDSGQSVTSSLDNTTFDADNFIYIERDNSSVWTIQHNLDTDSVVTYAFDEDFNKMVPEKVVVLSENVVEFTFPAGTNGLGVVSRAREILMTVNPAQPTIWRILHAFARKEVVMQFRFDSDENVYYPEIVRVSGFDENYAFAENLEEPTRVFVQKGLTDGDEGLSAQLWYFSDSGDYTDNGAQSTWVIKTSPTIGNNFFNVNCYETSTNRRIEPKNVIFTTPTGYYGAGNEPPEYSGVEGDPITVIEFDSVVDGFAALTEVGDVISFYGIIPRDAAGNMLKIDWRLEVETETDIYTFLTEGSADAGKFANTPKTVHYGTYISGITDLEEFDDEWWYYTFKASTESLAQLGIKDYDITGLELVNTRVTRTDKQRIAYSRISGIWKPFGANFIGHVRIFKDLNGLNTQLLDSVNEFLLDSITEILTS
jgi:hypothetical protein